MSLSKEVLEELYNEQRLSMAEIAERLGCSPNKVAYWMIKMGPRRDISDAIMENPDGDPFGSDRCPMTSVAISTIVGI